MMRYRPRWRSIASKASSSEAGVRYSSQINIVLPPAVPLHLLPSSAWSVRPSGRERENSLCCFAAHSYAARFYHHLDGVLDALPRVAQRRRQVLQRERVRVDLGGVKPLLAHEGLCAMRGALALAADAVKVDVVAHQVSDIDR